MKSSDPRPGGRLPRRTRGQQVAELDFNDDAIPPRAGDPVDEDEVDSLLGRRRARQAGLTGASMRGGPTADDLSPEILIDEDGSESAVRRHHRPEDSVLHHVSEQDVFSGLDDEVHEGPGDEGDPELDPEHVNDAGPGRKQSTRP